MLCWPWHMISRKVPEGPGRFPEVVPEAAGIEHAAEHRKALVMHGQGIGKHSKTKEINGLVGQGVGKTFKNKEINCQSIGNHIHIHTYTLACTLACLL